MRPIKLGILGAGSFVQRRILPALKEVSSIQLTCIHKQSLAGAKQVAAQFGIPYAVSSRKDLLEHPEVDAVFIATPNHCHEEDAIACAKALKPTLCEKPLAPTSQAIIRMQEAFAAHHTPLFVGQSLRFKPAIQKARELLQNGHLGKLLHLRAYFALSTPQENWRRKKSCGGGVLQDIGVHLIDLIHFISGEAISSVYAIANSIGHTDESEHTVSAIGRLTNGAFISFECSMNEPLRSGFEVVGDRSRLVSAHSLRQTDDIGESLYHVQEDGSFVDLPLRKSQIYVDELIHFAQVLKGETLSLISADVALSNQRVIEATYASIQQNLLTPN
jgi:predicted dehydrogenase